MAFYEFYVPTHGDMHHAAADTQQGHASIRPWHGIFSPQSQGTHSTTYRCSISSNQVTKPFENEQIGKVY